MIYLAEVHTPVQTLNLKYGVITRENQLRLVIQYTSTLYTKFTIL